MFTVLVAIALAFAFGGADQYLGSLAGLPWATEVSLLSAPWLLLAFVAGYTQRNARRAALLGLACTYAAVAGYGLMTLSPIEGAELTRQSVIGFVRSETAVIGGGLLTGPLFGWLGFRWRAARAWDGALVAAAVVCLEPLAHSMAGDAISVPTVWIAEVAVGATMAGYVVFTTLVRQRGQGGV